MRRRDERRSGGETESSGPSPSIVAATLAAGDNLWFTRESAVELSVSFAPSDGGS